jgi:hypothetical protein
LFGRVTSFTSSTPFGAIHVGDFLNSHLWQNKPYSWKEDDPSRIARVVAVEHMIYAHPDPKHKVCVFTEPVEDTLEVRLRK